ncbi:hypothetical protein L0F63_004990, partial [Massospora cicadina]
MRRRGSRGAKRVTLFEAPLGVMVSVRKPGPLIGNLAECVRRSAQFIKQGVALKKQLASSFSRLKKLEQRPFKVPMKDIYILGEGSIASFLYVYEAAMDGATDKQKVQYILPCLSRKAQELIVPHLDPQHIWPDIKKSHLAEFGSEQSLYREKQALLRLTMYEGETLFSFSEQLYLTAQRLATSNLLTLDDAIAAILTGLASQPFLARHIISVKRHFTTFRDIKEALLDIAHILPGELRPSEPLEVRPLVPILPAKPASSVRLKTDIPHSYKAEIPTVVSPSAQSIGARVKGISSRTTGVEKMLVKAKPITPPLVTVSPTSIVTLPMVENTPEADSEGNYNNVGYYLLGAPAEVEVPDHLNAGEVDEATIPEDTYLRQVLGEPIIIDTANNADEIQAPRTRALGDYSSLPIHIGKLILSALAVALDNNDYEMLIGTQFMIKHEGIINMKQGSLSLMNYEVPLVLSNKELIKNDYTCLVEHPSSTLPLHYVTSGRNTKKLHDSVEASDGIPIFAADEVVIKPGEQRVVDTKEKSTSKPTEAAVSCPKAQENRSSKDSPPRKPQSKPSRTEDVDSEIMCGSRSHSNKEKKAQKLLSDEKRSNCIRRTRELMNLNGRET